MKKMLLLFVIPALLAGGLNAQLSMEDQQILYLSFDDENDLGMNDEDVAVTDETGMIGDEGKFGGCAWFDGASYIIFDPIDGWNHGMDWTLSMWLKTESTDDFWGIFSFGTYSGSPDTDFYDEPPLRAGLILQAFENQLGVEISWVNAVWPEEGIEVPAWNDGEWHHLTVTNQASEVAITMYLDGILYAGPGEATIAADAEEFAGEEPEVSLEDDNLKFGVAGRGWLPEAGEEFPDIMYFDGYIDDVRLFYTVLSTEEITELNAYVPEATGLEEEASALQFGIYPNPASDYIQIQANSKDFEVDIYNISGQLVLSSFNKTQLDISSLSKGLYLVNAVVDGARSVQKLIVE